MKLVMFSRVALASLLLFSLPLRAQITQPEYASRRNALAALLGDGVLVALGSPQPEQDYISFNQNSPFKYLTGFEEPDAALVLDISGGKIVGVPHMFVLPSDPSREVWTGRRLGLDGVRKVLGFEPHPRAALAAVLDTLLARGGTPVLHVVGDYASGRSILTPDDQFIRAVAAKHSNSTVRPANGAVAQLRRVKSAAELNLIRKAVAITVDAQREAMRAMEPGQTSSRRRR